MSNYCDEAFYQQNIYTNTYSLWENSAYYDINNLSPQNYSSSWHRGNDEDFETRYTSGPTEAEPVEPPDHRNRRIVEKSALYEDTDSFYQDVTYTMSCSLFSEDNSTPPPTSEWAPWQNSGEESEEGSSGWSRSKIGRNNKMQKKLDKMLAKPVKMTKAESMMQKMGWQGGALGISGTGIVEPITPNAVYATQKIGFGLYSEPKPKPKPELVYANYKNRFTMNVLQHIHDFLKNNAEVELLFDRRLSKEERKRIHVIVKYVLNEEINREYERTAEMDLVLKISDVNCYVLQTQSEGEHPDRQICIYKEAPKHVYLIIPDDLRDDPSSEDLTTEQTASKDDASDNEAEEETNPFLRSITRNLKKTKDAEKTAKSPVTLPKENSVFEKILEFFSEFAGKKQYRQFKFLGPFSEEELEGIRIFMEKSAQYLNGQESEYKDIFGKSSFEIGEDVAGNTVINKRPKKK